MPRTRMPWLLVLAPCVCLAQAMAVDAVADIADLSLEELGNLRVTSASLRPERYRDAPASIYVITGEDIRRAGATSLPEALRLAPNLEVARVSGTTYAVSARGFQNVINNKLLVLLDGRTLYTAVLSGVLWDAQDVMLEDVDRIEVISGPGGALFGANAFSGVINILTKASSSTQGAAIVAGGGNLSRDVAARFGAKLGEAATYRVYGMHIERDNLRPAESNVADRMSKDGVGLRYDYARGNDRLALSGDGYDARIEGNGAPTVKLNGANLTGRWVRELGGDSRVKLSAWWDHTYREDLLGFRDRLDMLDLEGQYDLPAWNAHRISVGAGYRWADDRTRTSDVLRFLPRDDRLHWASVFAQDDVALTSTLSLTLGIRAQSVVYVSPEALPDARLSWNASPTQFFWTSASRVARTPGRIDRQLFFPASPPFLIRGGPDFTSETGYVYELGWRTQPRADVSLSATLFRQQLDDLRGGRLAPDGSGLVIGNEVKGTTTGLEAWGSWQAASEWRLSAGVLELRQDLRAKNGSGDLSGVAGLGNDPRHTVKLRSAWRVTPAVDFDIGVRYVSALSFLTTVPSYHAADARLAWRVNRQVELSLLGMNLGNRDHVEFDEHGFPARIPRAYYAQVRVNL